MIKKGDTVRFNGASAIQISFGNCDDPNKVLNVGATYVVSDVEEHKYYMKISLSGIAGKFNSASFSRAAR